MTAPQSSPLALYLRERRSRIDATSLGYPSPRRRTPGLRREEVAQRAGISQTWYTWLEQGRGGSPSAEVLERLSGALLLTRIEREHLFLLALGRLPEVQSLPGDDMSPRLQRVLDRLDPCPALIRTGVWDLVGWNEAASAFLPGLATSQPAERNLLRIMFCHPAFREAQDNWPETRQAVIGAFWRDAVRSGAAERAEALIAEIGQQSAEIISLWEQKEVQNTRGGIKYLRHPQMGRRAFELSAFSVDGRLDLTMVVFNPA